jgi:hypothetical protein
MVCYLYEARYCKVMTIAMYDIQLEDVEVQCVRWRKLNKVMKKIVWKSQTSEASWQIVHRPTIIHIVYDNGDPKVPMENQEHICFLH